MPAETHPTDVLVADLVGLYTRAGQRLEALVHAGLARGLTSASLGTPDQQRGDATHAYRVRQLRQVRAILQELSTQSRAVSPIIVGRSYGAGVVAIDRHLTATDAGKADVAGRFGGVHVRAVEALAGGLTDSLEAAAQRVGANVASVFQRADALEGALAGDGRVAGVRFIGRRIDDPYRRVALEVQAIGIASLDTRRQRAALLASALVREGVTDAVTGFVDRRGRRWSLEAYAAMVTRTTTREAMTAGTVNRLVEHGGDLVSITSHPHKADSCSPYDGKTFSLAGTDARYPKLERRPPFHPNCRHVLAPATASLDDFERELETWASGRPGTTTPPPAPAGETVPAPKPKPPKLTPAEKLQASIAAARASNAETLVQTAQESATQGLYPAQAARVVKLIRGEDHDYLRDTYTGRDQEDADTQRARDLEALASLENTGVVKDARQRLAAGDVPLDEASSTAIGKEALKLALREGKSGPLLRDLKKIQKDQAALDASDPLAAAAAAESAAFDRLFQTAGGSPEEKAAEAALAAAQQETARVAREVQDRRRELEDREWEVKRDLDAAYRDDVLAMLKKVRPRYGSRRIKYRRATRGDREREIVGNDVDAVSRLLPREWLEAGDADVDAGRPLTVEARRGRAFYQERVDVFDASKGRKVVYQAGDRSTLLHELGHYFQRRVGAIEDLERAFYNRRVAKRGRNKPTPKGTTDLYTPYLKTEDLQALKKLSDLTGNAAYADDEVTREDQFTSPYVGKVYGGAPLELLTMALQGLFYGENRMRTDDEDLIHWVLGILVTA